MRKPALLVFLSLTACGVTPIDAPGLPGGAPPPESSNPAPQDPLAQDAVKKVTIQGVNSIAYESPTSFSAVVEGTGSFSSKVTWSIESGGGTLSASSGKTVLYTAPRVSRETPVVLRAVSQMDSTKVGTFTLSVTPPSSTTEFLAGDYKGTEYKSRQDGDESGQYEPPVNFGENTLETSLKITKVSDTQLEVSFVGWYERFLVDLHADGTLTIPDQLAGSEFRWRGSAESFVIQGAKPGSGTWDTEGNLTLNWLSLFKVSSYGACPDENGSMNNTCYSYSHEYREQRITAKRSPTAGAPN